MRHSDRFNQPATRDAGVARCLAVLLIAVGIAMAAQPAEAQTHWGRDVQNVSSTTANHSRAMGGTSPNVANMSLTSISIYLGAQTGDVRLAVYTGGSLSDPSTATLLWDAGIVNPNGIAGFYTITHPGGGVSWPTNAVTWLAWKRDTGVAVYYSSSSANAGNFQTTRGRNNNTFSRNPSTAFPGTYGQTGTFSNFWYSIYVTYTTSAKHFSISHSGSASTCNAESITIEHHNSTHTIDTSYTGTITLSTSTSTGNWSLVTGSGVLNNAGNGSATYTYVAADSGKVILGLLDPNAETLNIGVTDGTDSEDPGEDPNLTFDGSCGPLPVAEWRMDEQSWSGIAGEVADFTGNGHAGTATGAATAASTPPLVGDPGTCRYGDFDGTSHYVQIPYNAALNGNSALTYTAWIQPQSWSGLRQVMAKSVHGGGLGRAQMGIFSEAGVLKARAETNAGREEVSGTLPVLNSWTHVAAVFGGTSLTLYVNGIAAGTTSFASTTLKSNTDPLNISKRVGTAQYFFDGFIDEVRVYTSALSQTQIQGVNAATHSCSTAATDHFAISHDGSAVVSVAENITISSHNSSHAIDTAYAGTITLSTSTANGDWSLVTGSGTLTNSGSGSATYAFAAGDNGSVVLGLLDTTAETVNINITDGTHSEAASEDASLTFAAAASSCTASSPATASFVALGDLAGGPVNSKGKGMCSDGAFVVGQSNSTAGKQAFKWDSTNGMVGLGDLAGGPFSSDAKAVSSDGTVIVGISNSTAGKQAFKWDSTNGMVGIGDLPGGIFDSDAKAVSANGAVIVGKSTSASGKQAFKWDATNGMSGLGDLPGGPFSSDAKGVSGDGSVIVGMSNSTAGKQAFKWDSANGMVGLGDLPGGIFNSDAKAVSANGLVIVGKSTSANGKEAFKWDATNGMVGLGDLPGGPFDSDARAVSADGSVIVGTSKPVSSKEAFIWDSTNGMRSLKTVLTGLGLNLTGWKLTVATAISADGLAIAGEGTNPSGNFEAWVAYLGGGSGAINHFSISHDGAAVNCQAENITIRAHDLSHAVNTSYTGTITLTTSTLHGDWSLVSGSGTLTNSGNGAASYAFAAADSGVVVLGLRNTFAETLNINLTAGSASEAATEDPSLVYSSAGFIFLANSTKNTIGLQIAGKASNVAPGVQTLELQAVRTSDDTGACEAALTGVNTIELAFECENPASCTTRQVAINGTSIAGNANGAVANYTGIGLDFGNAADTTAAFTFAYPDVGQLQLHARLTLSPSGEKLSGASNAFVVRPFALHVTATGNPGATGPTGSVFTSAGTNFSASARAVTWSAADDIDNNGIADNHNDSNPANNANLADNLAALNYGRETAVEQVSLSATLNQPAGGSNPGLAGGTTIGVFASGNGSTATARYNEVGIIELAAGIADGNYLGIGTAATASIAGRSGYVGRFNPARYAVTLSNIVPACASSFTYARQPFNGSLTLQAQNGAAGGNLRTANYRAGFVTLDPTTELVFVNDQTSSAYNSQTIAFTQNFDTGTTGEAVLSLQFRWDMGVQAPAVSAVRLSGITDEVTGLAGAPVTIGSTSMRYGRVALRSALGSELVNLAVPMHAEYYVNTSTGFVTHVNDSCSNAITLGFSNFAGNLIAGETCVLDTGSPGSSGAGCAAAGPLAQRYAEPPSAGNFNLFLKAPGAGNDGSVTVGAVVPAWLKFDWDASVSGDENPSTRATFGIYAGGDKPIYRRELY